MADFSGQVLADKYRIDSILREGSLGSLFHGTHLLMEKPVAVKILPPALAVDEIIAKRFNAEAKTVSRISHPNILNVTDYGADKSGASFIVFENADGETLKEAIRREGKFSLERANQIIRQVAAALSVGHANGVIHKNLTGENIVLTKTANETDAVKVLNFGAAPADEEDGAFEEVSGTDAEYLSPEQCTQTAAPDARSDVYSLGVILYEMLAGEVPFTAEKTSDVMLKHAQEPPLPLSAFRHDLPHEAESVVLTALAKNPDSRYQTATDLAAALNLVTAENSNSAEKVPYPNLSQPVAVATSGAAAADDGAQNNLWKTAFIVLSGIAVMAALFIYITDVKRTDPPTQLMTDANGQPVQPVNPATGTSEQSLSNMGAYTPEMFGNSNMLPGGPGAMPQTMPGGDGYDPWARGGTPPAGAPPSGSYVPYVAPPTGQYYDGNLNSNSPFMAPDGNTYILVPKNANTNVNAQAPKKTPAAGANANTQTTPGTAKPSPVPPAANTAQPAAPADTTPATKPTPKPTAAPKNNTTQKTAPSGKELDT